MFSGTAIKKVLSVFLLFVLAFTVCGQFTSAATDDEIALQEANKKLRELNQKKTELEAQLSNLESQVKEAQSAVYDYSYRKNLVSSQIETVNALIEVKNSEIALKQEQIDQKQVEYDKNYELFKQRLRAMYMNNNSTTLSVILGANSFSEVLTYAETVSRISQHDTDLMNTLLTEKTALETAKTDLEADVASLEEDKAELDTLYSQLAGLLREANSELSEAQALEQATQADYDAILAERERQEAIIDEIMRRASVINYVGGEWGYPLPYSKTYTTSGFGWRKLYGRDNYHGGVDISGYGIYGQPICAVNAGEVVTAYYGTTGYGYYVIIDHGGGYKTLYGHMSAIYVSVGQYVNRGDQIGAVGSTGNSTGPHLHFEVRVNGERVYPYDYIPRFEN